MNFHYVLKYKGNIVWTGGGKYQHGFVSTDDQKINARLSFPSSNLFHAIGTFPVLFSKCTIRLQYDKLIISRWLYVAIVVVFFYVTNFLFLKRLFHMESPCVCDLTLISVCNCIHRVFHYCCLLHGSYLTFWYSVFIILLGF